MSEPAKGPSLGDVVGAAAFVVGLTTAWLYVAGWSYAYNYFDRFRIPLLLADLPREHLFVYGALTVWKAPVASAVIAMFGVALVVACVLLRKSLGRGLLAGLLILAVAVLFVLARVAGIHTAAEDADRQRATDYGAYPRVALDVAADVVAPAIADTLGSGCARLILATDDRVFLIVPRREAPALELSTLVVRWNDIRALTISGRYTSCG